jgi:hypothetical protein
VADWKTIANKVLAIFACAQRAKIAFKAQARKTGLTLEQWKANETAALLAEHKACMADEPTMAAYVLAFLVKVRKEKAYFTAQARRRGLTLDELSVAAIIEMAAQHVEQHRPRRGKRKVHR